METISVIIPVYNVERYIEQCVNSVIHQTYQALEIILVDDGSTDESGRLCDKFAETDSRIVVIHKENGGLSDARNIGLERANGDYIGFVDSDDWISTQMYEGLLNAIKREDADIAVCGWTNEYVNFHIEKKPPAGIRSSSDALIDLLENRIIVDHACDKLYKAELFRDVTFPVGKTYEDIRTTYKLFEKAERIVYVPKCYYYYRQRNGSISRGKFNIKRMEWLRATEELVEVPTVSINSQLKAIVRERILRTKCYLLREMLIGHDNESDYLLCKDKLIKELRSNWFHVFAGRNYSKSLKIMALLSLCGEKTLSSFFSNHYSGYIEEKFEYYE